MAEVSLVVEQLRRRVPGGIGTYTRGLLQGLAAMGDAAPPVTLVASRVSGVDPLAQWGRPLRTAWVPAPWATKWWDVGGVAVTFPNAGIVHAASLATPYPRRLPVTVMVHDLAWREVPESFPARGRRWHEAAFRRAIRRAARIVVPSERTAGLVGRDDVVVIPEGCDHLPAPDADGVRRLLAGLGVSGPFLLSVSTLEPRKNLARLISAYGAARPALPEPWPLVVVGPEGWGATLAPAEGVVMTGAVSDAVLAGLYAAARCLAYVPLVEGWGLPAVEAMRADTPVVASPMPSTGEAALVVDPLSSGEIAEGLVAVAVDGPTRESLVAAGRARAASLTWEAAARAHVGLWESVA